MGHQAIAVLDGGLPAWKAQGLPVEPRNKASLKLGNFRAQLDRQQIVDMDQVAELLKSDDSVVVDARSAERFNGVQPEPRAGLRSGHMPGSLNVPFSNVLDGGHMRSRDQLEKLFAPLARKDQRLVFSCGSGVTACIDALAAEIAGYKDIAVYDGSWSEWGLRKPGV